MTSIKFEHGWADFFSEAGLKTFDDFFGYCQGRLINRNTKRNVVAMSLNCAGKEKTFFMKRYFRPHFKDMLFTIGNYGRLCSQAELEYKNATHLLANGIDTYRPVCFGEHRFLGIERSSFFVTEKLAGRSITDFVGAEWNRLNKTERENLTVQLGRFVRRIHDAQVSLPDLYLWHIFIEPAGHSSDGAWRFSVIDLHRMKVNVNSKGEFIGNLARLDFSLSEDRFDRKLRRVFLDAYLADGNAAETERLSDKVRKLSARLARRRKRPLY